MLAPPRLKLKLRSNEKGDIIADTVEAGGGSFMHETIYPYVSEQEYLALEEKLKVAEQALVFYADPENHYYHAYDCEVDIAEKALKQIRTGRFGSGKV
jgi:hypothetical protein